MSARLFCTSAYNHARVTVITESTFLYKQKKPRLFLNEVHIVYQIPDSR